MIKYAVLNDINKLENRPMKMQKLLKKHLTLIVLGSLFSAPVFANFDLENTANNIGLSSLTSHKNDTDNDGVADALDQCANTENGRFVDDKGCEFDTDADGIKNSSDKCPQTPLGLRVKSNGCL